jgi:N-acetylglucosamine kinase-like BadF-type ATPase
MTSPLILAVDGGNSKTDVALADADGRLLALVRGPSSSPHRLGVEPSMALIGSLLAQAMREAALPTRDRPLIEVARVQLAGADQPDEEQQIQRAAEEQGWATRVLTGNDTFAVLRAGTDRGWGVAVVCGAGINCIGLAPDGRSCRFPALGPITGDWGGGSDVGLAALGAAARSADGRGPATVLERSVPEHFGLASPFEVARAIHLDQMPYPRLAELAPVVFSVADDDSVAAGILVRLADEISAFANVAIERLGLIEEEFEVVLGGGLVRRSPKRLLEAVRAEVGEIAPRAHVVVADAPPIAGAALLALDDLGASAEAKARVRHEIVEADGRLAWNGIEDGGG